MAKKRGPIKKVFIFTREKYRNEAADLADVLYEDFGIYSEIRNMKEIYGGGIKKYQEIVENIKEKNKKIAVVCFNLRRHICSGRECVIKNHSAVPVVPIVIDNSPNAMGAAVIKILTVLSKNEKKKKEVRCE